MKISIYSIVKNEEADIEKMIQSAIGAYEHVIVDTGSTDNTIEIIKKYPHVKLFTDYTWKDDFSDAKNHAASKCTGDWLCSLDADCYLEEGFLEKAQKMVDDTKHDVLFVELHSVQYPTNYHRRGKLYRNNGKIFYTGMAHEDLNVHGQVHESGILPKIYYGYSPNHAKDPDRYIRIMTKQVEKDPNGARWQFYLGASYYDKRDYNKAIEILEKYVTISSYQAERADAFYKIANCYWYTQRGEQARQACLKAIGLNPDFKAALKLMSDMTYEPNKSKWKKLADLATNADVLFKQ